MASPVVVCHFVLIAIITIAIMDIAGNIKGVFLVINDIKGKNSTSKSNQVLVECERTEKLVRLITSEFGDWQILEVDGVQWASGHSISENDWLGLISEHFDGLIERTTVSDEEMESL